MQKSPYQNRTESLIDRPYLHTCKHAHTHIPHAHTHAQPYMFQVCTNRFPTDSLSGLCQQTDFL